jgi:AcrR family transcriptional regulator
VPKIVDHERYREELLAQCFELFAQHGYAALSMRAIAEELGVSTGTLYYYFSSKEDLFNQIVQGLLRQDILQASTQIQAAETPARQLEALFRFIDQYEDYFLKQIVLLVDYHQQHQLSADHSPANALGYMQIVSEVVELQDPNVVKLLMSHVIGLLVLRLFEGRTESLVAQTELLRKLLADHAREPGHENGCGPRQPKPASPAGAGQASTGQSHTSSQG